jgi:hypothetical protein
MITPVTALGPKPKVARHSRLYLTYVRPALRSHCECHNFDIRTIYMPSTLTKMQPNLYQYITISRSKNKEYILKVSEYGKKIHATVKLPPLRVIRAQLDVDGNGFGHHTVTLLGSSLC